MAIKNRDIKKNSFTKNTSFFEKAGSKSSLKMSSMEVLCLTLVPICGAVWLYTKTESVQPVASVRPVVREPSAIVEPLKPKLPEIAKRVDVQKRFEPPVVEMEPLKPIPKEVIHEAPRMPTITLEEARRQEAEIQARIDSEQELFSKDALQSMNQANQLLKMSMQAKAVQDANDRSTQQIQQRNRTQRTFSTSVSGAIGSSGAYSQSRGPSSVELLARDSMPMSNRGLVPAYGGQCSTSRAPASPDASCRANYPCRICGGCCCGFEARLAGLM